MQQLQKSIDINAPASRVFEFMTEPTNLPTVWPSLVEVSNVERRGGGSCSFDWVYKMAGIRFNGHCDQKVVRPLQQVEVHNTGIPSTFRWTYEDRAGSCRLTCEAQYTMPVPVLGRLAEAVAVKINDRELDTVLANVRTTLELPAAEGASAGRR